MTESKVQEVMCEPLYPTGQSITVFESVEEKSISKLITYNIKKEEKNLLLNILENEKYFKKNFDKIVFTDTENNNNIKSPFNNGLIGTIITAYSNHIPLVLRADDFWFAILCNFGKYIEKNAEELRDLFVEHEGQKDLKILVESENISEVDWIDVVDKMCNLINKNVKSNIKSLIKPEFSTTTKRDELICNVSLMTGMSKYFNYTFAYECGLPKVTLLGVLDDWLKLKEKVSNLHFFDIPLINDWIEITLPILDKFIDTFKGNKRENFWQRICTSRPRGSGGEKFFGGWMFCFAPFDKDMNYILNKKEDIEKNKVYAHVIDGTITSCSCSVKSKFVIGNGFVEKEYKINLLGGLLSTGYNLEENYVKPSSGFIITVENEINEESLLDIYVNKKPSKLKLNNRIMYIPNFILFLFKRYDIPYKDNITEVIDKIIEKIVKVCFTFAKYMKINSYSEVISVIEHGENKTNIFELIFFCLKYNEKYVHLISENYGGHIKQDFINKNLETQNIT